MININTIEDVKILKELVGSSIDDSRIVELEREVQSLSKRNEELTNIAKEQHLTIKKLKGSLVTPDQCRDIVFDLLNASSLKKKSPTKKKRGAPKKIKIETDEFDIADKQMKRKFNKILIEGNTLIHYTIKNQRMKLPITTLELLALVEVYQYRQRKLINKDCDRICKLFNINKVQFGKLYYNLKEGAFFNTLDEISNQIKRTNFRYIDGFIHIIDGSKTINTKIDSKLFNTLLNIFVNSDQPYATIYKLSLENKELNPVHLLSVLKKNVAVSKAITNVG